MSTVNYNVGDDWAGDSQANAGFIGSGNAPSLADVISAFSNLVIDQEAALNARTSELNARASELKSVLDSYSDSIDFGAIQDEHTNDLRLDAIASSQAQMHDVMEALQAHTQNYAAFVEIASDLNSKLSEMMQNQSEIL